MYIFVFWSDPDPVFPIFRFPIVQRKYANVIIRSSTYIFGTRTKPGQTNPGQTYPGQTYPGQEKTWTRQNLDRTRPRHGQDLDRTKPRQDKT